ncbi:hypothetical protein NDU88_002454 [Pleurodeles waltl]|uniref:Uncharacterized protein n=1 Tax=Pleurodeles waltl TaxID=8319 RepID=A0AAV7P701_PLEWA|nr:hypothetical protein NDU88_002454 [Pleurodeles waltl]
MALLPMRGDQERSPRQSKGCVSSPYLGSIPFLWEAFICDMVAGWEGILEGGPVPAEPLQYRIYGTGSTGAPVLEVRCYRPCKSLREPHFTLVMRRGVACVCRYYCPARVAVGSPTPSVRRSARRSAPFSALLTASAIAMSE